MLANNEIGTIQPFAEIAEIVRVRAPRAVLHTDAVQAFPWLDVAALAPPADLISISAHKFGGPKGSGVLVVRDGVPFVPRQVGGGQERERRSGTQNVAGIVALAEAARLTVDERKAVVDRIAPMRDRLADGLRAAVPHTIETGDRASKVAGNCHLRTKHKRKYRSRIKPVQFLQPLVRPIDRIELQLCANHDRKRVWIGLRQRCDAILELDQPRICFG